MMLPLRICMIAACISLPAEMFALPAPTEKTSPNVKVDTLAICVLVEDDSYYTSMQRTFAAVDIAISNANAYVLPSSIKLQAVFESAGPSCTKTAFSAASNLYRLMSSGVACDMLLGAGCPSSTISLYSIADSLNLLFLGNPAAGINAFSLDNTEDHYPLLTSVAFNFGDLSDFVMTFLQRHGYRHIALLSDDVMSFSMLLGKSLRIDFDLKDKDLAVKCTDLVFSSLHFRIEDYVRRLLKDATGHARVIALFAHAAVVRELMVAAHGLGFTDGEYVYLAVEFYELAYWGKIDYTAGDASDTIAKEAFRSLLVFSVHVDTRSLFYEEFAGQVKSLSRTRYNFTFNPLEHLDLVVRSFYEAIQMYAHEVANMSRQQLKYRDGLLFRSRLVSSAYDVDLTKMFVGDDGQRDLDYDIKAFNSKSGDFEIQMIYIQHPEGLNVSEFVELQPLHWPNNKPGELPPDQPACGFQNEKCQNNGLPPSTMAVAVAIPIVFLMGFAVAATVAFLKLRSLHLQYNPDWWKLNPHEVAIKENHISSVVTASRKTLESRNSSIGTARTGRSCYLCDILASYKGSLVMLTDVTSMTKRVTPELAAQIGLLKDISHGNLQAFIGITVNVRGECEHIVSELCSKGCLTDVLENDIYKLDWAFKNTLIRDIVFGMDQIHTSKLVSHGRLSSDTCLIDSRFCLKIADYGLPYFRSAIDLDSPKISDPNDVNLRDYASLLWRAPELLRQVMPRNGTQRGDVYSFAIVLQQIILRAGPFELPSEPFDISPQEIVKEVINTNIPPARPRVPRATCSNELYALMEQCWEEVPLERPTFSKTKERLRKVIGDVGDNIVDVLFKRMEQYALDLETKVAEKTEAFVYEKSRSEQLLSQLLPASVAAALMKGLRVEPEYFECVTIYYSDVVGFTKIAAAGTPMDVVDLLNNLYTFFDGVLEKYDVYKVETIGDAYMVSSGLPVRNGNRHASEICFMALTLVVGIVHVPVPNRPRESLQVRVGINSGPCVAGIVGMKMPRYCLFGDTVNGASRMESSSEPMKIQTSESTKRLLDDIGGFHVIERDISTVKVKGIAKTFWLLP